MSTVTIKAYLYNNWEQDAVEIRRFTVEQDVAASYDYLVEKLRTVFPSLREAVFDIYWEDDEKDRVSISTDEELFLAISGLQTTVLKLYLRKKTSTGDQGQTSTAPTRHPGIVCDGCQQGIAGVRYNCLSCPDYDLCAGCEAKGLHVAHDMAAIERPQYPRSCHFTRPSCFTGFNPWASMYGPRTSCWGQYPKATGSTQQQQQTNKQNTTDDNQFVLSANERECVQNIGGAVASFLKPYGINVNVGVAEAPKDDKENEQGTAAAMDTENKTTAEADQSWVSVVEQLKGMGFDNDGGWLTELVKAKDNDIHKVLDALNHGR